MTTTADPVLGTIRRIFPKLGADTDDWDPSVKRELAKRVRAMNLTEAQAEAALVNLKLELRYHPRPAELLAALQRAATPAASQAKPEHLSEAAETWRRWLDDRANRAAYQDLAREWLAENRPRAMHLATMAGALLQPRDPMYGPMSREFLAWVADRARADGVAIGSDGQIVRASGGAK